MTALKSTTILSPLPPTRSATAFPPLPGTGQLALDAAARVKGMMAKLGVTVHDDLVATMLGLLIVGSDMANLDLAKIFRNLSPAMFAEFKASGAPRSPSGPWDLLEFEDGLPSEELARMAAFLDLILGHEVRRMGFAPHMCLIAAMWILVALLVAEHGIERARMRFATLLRGLR